jgi:hypothetical protein
MIIRIPDKTAFAAVLGGEDAARSKVWLAALKALSLDCIMPASKAPFPQKKRLSLGNRSPEYRIK